MALPLCLSAQKESVRQYSAPGDYESQIAVSDSGVKRLVIWMDDWDKLVNPPASEGVRASNLNLSKSNVRSFNSSRSNIRSVSEALAAAKSSAPPQRPTAIANLKREFAKLDQSLTELHGSIVEMGAEYQAHATSLKAKHETVKNAINNIR